MYSFDSIPMKPCQILREHPKLTMAAILLNYDVTYTMNHTISLLLHSVLLFPLIRQRLMIQNVIEFSHSYKVNAWHSSYLDFGILVYLFTCLFVYLRSNYSATRPMKCYKVQLLSQGLSRWLFLCLYVISLLFSSATNEKNK